ncbi:hypothetical protein CHUAL_001095 [Chamberlinius hualienensis]
MLAEKDQNVWRSKSLLRPSMLTDPNNSQCTQTASNVTKSHQTANVFSHQKAKLSECKWKSKETDLTDCFQWIHMEQQNMKCLYLKQDLENNTNLKTINNYQQIIKTLTSERNSYKIDNEKLQIQFKEWEVEAEKYKKELEISDNWRDKLESEMKTYDERLASCETMKKEINSFNENYLSRFEALGEKFQQLQLDSSANFTLHRQQIKDLKTYNQNLVTKCLKSDNVIAELTQKDKQVEMCLTLISEERDSLKVELENLMDEYNRYKDNSLKDMAFKDEESSKFLDNLQSEIDLMKINNNELVCSLEKKDHEIVELRTQLDDFKSQLDEFRKESCQQVEVLTAKEAELKQEMQQLQTKNKDYKIKAVKNLKKYDKLKQVTDKELALRNSNIRHLLQQIENLKSDVEKEVEEKNKISKEFQRVRVEMLKSIEDDKNDFSKMMLDSENHINNINVKLTEKVLEIEEANRNYSNLQSSLVEKDKQIANLNSKLNEQTQQIEEINKKNVVFFYNDISNRIF